MSADPKFSEPSFDPGHGFGLLLKCPRCGDGYLHHRGVAVVERVGEDEDSGEIAALVAGRIAVRTDAVMDGNFSPRRGSIVVSFACEVCGDFADGGPGKPSLRLSIVQHKGCTYIGWVS
jgi:hypothetical protein